MRVAVVGVTGNVGTSLLEALVDEPAVDSVVGIARRVPELDVAKTEWVAADVRSADLAPIRTPFRLRRGADGASVRR
jgi:uncharacterized protein YbjT (DUF2867 family)